MQTFGQIAVTVGLQWVCWAVHVSSNRKRKAPFMLSDMSTEISPLSRRDYRGEVAHLIYTGRHVSKIQLWQLVTKQEMKQVLHIELLPGDTYVAKFLLRM